MTAAKSLGALLLAGTAACTSSGSVAAGGGARSSASACRVHVTGDRPASVDPCVAFEADGAIGATLLPDGGVAFVASGRLVAAPAAPALLVVRLERGGRVAFVRPIGPGRRGIDPPLVAADDEGAVYVAGVADEFDPAMHEGVPVEPAGPSAGSIVVKLDPQGQHIWTRALAPKESHILSLKGGGRRLFVRGVDEAGGNLVGTLDLGGDWLWRAKVGGDASHNVIRLVDAFAVGPGGEVTLGGSGEGGLGRLFDGDRTGGFVTHLNSDGQGAWTWRLPAALPLSRAAANASGDILVVGQAARGSDALFFDRAGARGVAHLNDVGLATLAAGDGDGFLLATAGLHDAPAAMFRLTRAGTRSWAERVECDEGAARLVALGSATRGLITLAGVCPPPRHGGPSSFFVAHVR